MCKTCDKLGEIKDIIKTYKDGYAKYEQKERLYCSIVQCVYSKKLKRIVSTAHHRKGPLKYCPECGVKLKK